MAGSVAERLTRASTPEAIEQDLAALWRELARRTPAARTIMSNLVVFQKRELHESVDAEAPFAGVPLEDVVRSHPSRVIVLMHAADAAGLEGPAAAAVGILIFDGDGARHAIEQITIRSSCGEASLPSIVRGLTLGDLPTSVWWTEDLSEAPPLTALVTMGRQLLYDSRQWRDVGAGLTTLATLVHHAHAPDLADVNWRRLAPLRQALRFTLGDAAARDDRDLRIRVTHPHGDAARAWLLAGWLASQRRREGESPPVVAVKQGEGESLGVSIESGNGPSLSASMTPTEVIVTDVAGAAPSTIAVPRESDAEAVVAELRALGRDTGLVAAILAANERLTAP